MRSNGLTAPAYTPVADLDPQVADAVLADLRTQGVAAYAKPVESPSTMGFDRPEFGVSVKDRLYVDTTASRRVRQLIARQDPGLVVDNDDLTWAQIVATFDQPVTPGSAAWPAQEDLDDDAAHASAPTDAPTAAPTPPARPEWDDDVGPSDRQRRNEPTDPLDIREHFVPDPPPPLPRLDPHKQLAWLGLAGGPLLLLIAALFTVALPPWLTFLAVAGFVVGFLTLIVTMDSRTDEDRDSDDGAVV